MARSGAVPLLVLIALTACSGAAGVRRGSSLILTRAEIGTSNGTTAYEVLEQLRPQFLRARGRSSMQNPAPLYAVVYLNDVRAGGLDSLRTIRVGEIDEIRYIGAADATTRYGTGHGGGVIHILAIR
jgi:hypothetical protein